LVLREIERRLSVADRLAACIDDPRDPASTVHTLADIIRFRMLMIAAGYEDGNDATGLRSDPLFKLALERLPSDRDLCSQSTISRLENLPDARTLLRLGRALVDVYCGSFRQVPKRIVLDVDDSFDAVHGSQQLRLFNAHYDEYGFQPIVVFDAEAASSPPSCARRSGRRASRSGRFCAASSVRSGPTGRWSRSSFVPTAITPARRSWTGARRTASTTSSASPPTRTLRRHVAGLEDSTAARFEAAPSGGKVRRFKEFFDAAKTWSRVRRIVARVEAGSDGTDTRFIVTNLGHGSGRSLYQDLYCRRGQAENHIKAWKTHLAADRTSCPKATACAKRGEAHPSSGCSCTPAPIGCCGACGR
jgi:Transposase DDE domain group 1